MSGGVKQAGGVKVELDVVQFGQEVAREVAQHLACLFPTDAAEFWGVLAEQASRERQRVAAMLDVMCSHQDGCPYKSSVLAGISLDTVDDPPAAPVTRKPKKAAK